MPKRRVEFAVQRVCSFTRPSFVRTPVRVVVQVLKFYTVTDADSLRWRSTAGEVKWFLGCYTRPVTLLPRHNKRKHATTL